MLPGTATPWSIWLSWACDHRLDGDFCPKRAPCQYLARLGDQILSLLLLPSAEALQPMAMVSTSMPSYPKRGRPRRFSHGLKPIPPSSRTTHEPPGLAGLHWLANRLLLISLLVSAVLCVLELQVRINWSRTYANLQEARTTQQQLMESRSQLMASFAAESPYPQTNEGDLLISQDTETLVLPAPRVTHLKPPAPSGGLGWLQMTPILRGY